MLKTHIITACWKGYEVICKSANNYTHFMVNHSEHFGRTFNLLTPKSNPNFNLNPN